MTRALCKQSNAILSDFSWYGNFAGPDVKHENPGGFNIYYVSKQTFNWFSLVCVHEYVPVSVTSFVSVHMYEIRGSHKLEHTHAKHALVEEIGEKEGGPDKRWPGCHRLLQGWRDVPLAARWVKTRQSCVPQALFVPDDSQLMSYLGQSTLRIECVHREKKRGGEREGWQNNKKTSAI